MVAVLSATASDMARFKAWAGGGILHGEGGGAVTLAHCLSIVVRPSGSTFDNSCG